MALTARVTRVWGCGFSGGVTACGRGRLGRIRLLSFRGFLDNKGEEGEKKEDEKNQFSRNKRELVVLETSTLRFQVSSVEMCYQKTATALDTYLQASHRPDRKSCPCLYRILAANAPPAVRPEAKSPF